MGDALRYRAFLSYNRADRESAKRIQARLERYTLPNALRATRPELKRDPRPLKPVFRDEDELVPGSDLPERVRTALELSEFLIVICSPNAARSAWVEREILEFIALGREHRILAVVVDGEPNADRRGLAADLECLPPALRYKVTRDSTLTAEPTDPLWVDWRKSAAKDERRSFLRVVAALLELASFDDLMRRDARARQGRMIGLVAGVVAGLLVTGAAGYEGWRLTFSSTPIETGRFKRFFNQHLVEAMAPSAPTYSLSAAAKDYEIAYATDLNHDGVIDFIVLNHNDLNCGSGGCAYEVWTGDFSGKFVRVSSEEGLPGVKDIYVRNTAGAWDDLVTTTDAREDPAQVPVFTRWAMTSSSKTYLKIEQWYCDGVEYRYCDTPVKFCFVDPDTGLRARNSAAFYKEPYQAQAAAEARPVAATDEADNRMDAARQVGEFRGVTADGRWFMVTSPRGKGADETFDTLFLKRDGVEGTMPLIAAACAPPSDQD